MARSLRSLSDSGLTAAPTPRSILAPSMKARACHHPSRQRQPSLTCDPVSNHAQIQYPDRPGRLILVMSLALYWAVSTGMWDAAENPTPSDKKDLSSDPESSPEASFPGSPEDCAKLSDLCSKPCRYQGSGGAC